MSSKSTGRAIRGSKPPVNAFFAALNPERPDVAKASFSMVKERFKAWLEENRGTAKPAAKRGRKPTAKGRASSYVRRLNGSKENGARAEA